MRTVAHMVLCFICGVWIVANRLAAGEPTEALWLGLFALAAMLLPLLLEAAEVLLDLVSGFLVWR